MSAITDHLTFVRVRSVADIPDGNGFRAVQIETCGPPRRTGTVWVSPRRWAEAAPLLERNPEMVCSVDPSGAVVWE